MAEYRRGAHTVFQIHLHLVWTTKYRKAVLIGEVSTRVRDLIWQICGDHDVKIMKGHSYFFRLLRRAVMLPGWIFSKVCRQRESFSVIDSTVAVQTNGLGSLFHAVRNASMDAFKSSTL